MSWRSTKFLKRKDVRYAIRDSQSIFPVSQWETRIFDDLKRKAQWAEAHGFVWFDVMDHMIQIAPGVGEA